MKKQYLCNNLEHSMDIAVVTSIIAIAVVSALIGSQASKTKKTEPFLADKAEWYYEQERQNYLKTTGKSDKDLNDVDNHILWEYSCNHCAMFLTWAIMIDCCGDIHLKDEPEAVVAVKKREMTGTAYFIKYCDCKLSREDFSDKILPFVDAYYSRYLNDYCGIVQKKLNKNPWGLPFSWEDYEVIEKALDKAYRHWKFWEKPVVKIGS